MSIEMVEIPRWWIVDVIKSIQDPLPSGILGDNIFSIRTQLGDLIEKHDKAAQDQRDVASRFDASG